MKKDIYTILLLALLIRLLYFGLGFSRQNADDTVEWKKMARYFAQGKGVLEGAQELDPKRPPIYPLYLAAHFKLFGEANDIPIQISQIILSSLSCVMLYLIASVLLNQKIGFWSGILLALYPPAICYSPILQSETLFVFLLFLFLLLWVYAWGISPIIPGIALGLLNLCRGTMLFFSLFLILVSLFWSHTRKELSKTLWMIGISVLVIAPWSWRNYKVYNTLTPIVGGGPELFWFGALSLDSQKKYGNSSEYLEIKDKIPKNLKESEKFYTNLAIQRIAQDPINYVILTFKKFFYFWLKPIGHEILLEKSSLLALLLLIVHGAFILLGAHGIILTKSHGESLFPLYVLIAYFALFHTLLVPMPRFRLPIEPLILIFSTRSLYYWIKKIHAL